MNMNLNLKIKKKLMDPTLVVTNKSQPDAAISTDSDLNNFFLAYNFKKVRVRVWLGVSFRISGGS